MTAFIGRREFITLIGGAAIWPQARSKVRECGGSACMIKKSSPRAP